MSGPTIDLRSDTLTRPTPAMRRAMAEAPVGDDVWGEDPTVQALEARVAALLAKPAALFVPSGTMGNLIAVLAHTRRGDELILGDRSHVYLNEGGGPAVLGAVTPFVVPTLPNGELAPAAVATAIRKDDVHFPRTGLLCLENTHNYAGGLALPPAFFAAMRAVARPHGLPVHLDGARLFNAAIALGLPPAALAADVDSVMVAFSKGLGAPVGSALAGEAAFVAEARRWRKKLGGGMRQAGILAAAALYALDHHMDRLAEDHANARRLAEGIGAIPGLAVAQARVDTNIVFAACADAPALVAKLAEAGVKCAAVGPDRVRFVTHLDVDRPAIDEALTRLAAACR